MVARTGVFGLSRWQDVGDPPVVGSEVVPPVRDGVRLVDDEQPEPAREPVEHPSPEAGVGQPLRRDQQHVEVTSLQRRLHGRPLVDVGGVEGGRREPGPRRGRDLVAHQRQQRRDHERRSRALRATDRGGRPVDRRLAPAGGLHDEHPGGRLAQGGDREWPGRHARARPARPSRRSPVRPSRRGTRSGAWPGRRVGRRVWWPWTHRRGHLRRRLPVVDRLWTALVTGRETPATGVPSSVGRGRRGARSGSRPTDSTALRAGWRSCRRLLRGRPARPGTTSHVRNVHGLRSGHGRGADAGCGGGAARRRHDDLAALDLRVSAAGAARGLQLLLGDAAEHRGDPDRRHRDARRPARRADPAATPPGRGRRAGRARRRLRRHGAVLHLRRLRAHVHRPLPPDAGALPDARRRAADLRAPGARRGLRPRPRRPAVPAGVVDPARSCWRCPPARRTGTARTPATPASARSSGSAGRAPDPPARCPRAPSTTRCSTT